MSRFDKACEEWRADLIALITDLKTQIGDEYRAYEDSDEPGMAITIATDDECSGWVYQTGDNSYSGACYIYPHWGLGAVYRDSDPAEVVDELLSDLGESWFSSQPSDGIDYRPNENGESLD